MWDAYYCNLYTLPSLHVLVCTPRSVQKQRLQTGLETYTLRSGYYTALEAERLNHRTNACPGTDVPICLVGLRPFLGAKQLHVSGDHLVLLSSVGDTYVAAKPDQPEVVDNESWTIYSLALPSSLSLHSDMIQLGERI